MALGRKKPEPAPAVAPVLKEGGKGRPTPKRKDAEAAARARAKIAKDPKAQRRQARELRIESSREIRDAIKSGDERYLGKRDKGPVRRFTRDFVDSRLNMAEFSIPLIFIGFTLSAAGQGGIGTSVMNATLLVVALDSFFMTRRLKKEVRTRFPEESTKGLTFYALTRALQLRFMRIPKTNAKIGQQLPERYR